MSAAMRLATPSDRRDSPVNILGVAGDPATRELMAQAVGRSDDAARIVVGTAETALSHIELGAAPAILLLDLSASADALADLTRIVAAASETKIIALGVMNDIGLFRDLIRAGASDYLVKPFTPASLEAAIAAASQIREPADMSRPRLGKLALFVGARGGVGTTTCAVNTAWLLAQELGQRTALVDLDLHFGTVALSLDIDPGRGLREALAQPMRIDSLFIDRAMVRQGDRLAVLSAEEPVEEETEIASSAIEILLYELRQKFDWVIVDLPRGLIGEMDALLASVTHAAIITEPTLAGLRDTIRLDAFLKSTAAGARLLTIDGGAGRAPRSPVSRAEFEKGFGRKLDLVVPFDAKAALAGANAGRPLAAVAGTSPAAQAARDLAVALAGPGRPSIKKSLWQRFGKKVPHDARS
jgi:pilus assembly protein CpaE